MKWQKTSNGHTLTVEMNTKGLISDIDIHIAELKQLADQLEGCVESGASEEDMQDLKYGLSVVQGGMDEYMDPSDCIADLEQMKECILKMDADEEGNTVWPLIALKKNGTFKRNCKPIIREESFGTYYEDSYGWYTEVLRIEADTDTEANVVLTNIIIHY